MTTPSIQGLETAVAQLVREHLAAYETELQATLQRMLARPRRAVGTARKREGTKPTKVRAPKRTAEELDALGERFVEVLRQHPGEGMAVLSDKLGLRAGELAQPVKRLKEAGRVRTVGEKSRTRYFSMKPATT